MKKIVSICMIICFCFQLIGCSKDTGTKPDPSTTKSEEKNTTLTKEKAFKKAGKLVKKMTLEEKLGQLFIVDLDKLTENEEPVTELTEEVRQLIAQYQLGGVVLDGDNIQNEEQIKALNKELAACLEIPMYIGTEEEGGGEHSIANNNEELSGTGYVTPQEMGKNMTQDQIRDTGKVIGKELVDLGFNLNFAPTADVFEMSSITDVEAATLSAGNALGDEAPKLEQFLKKNKKGKISKKKRKKAMKQYAKAMDEHYKKVEKLLKECTEEKYIERCFGGEEDKVSDAVAAMVEGMHSEKVATVLKTFPGISPVVRYHKLVLGDINTGVSRLRRINFAPYAAGIEAGADMIMVGHVALSKVDENTPASMSRVIMSDLLRDEMDFEGVVMTEPMDLPVITTEYTTEQAVIRAIVSGASVIYNPEDLEEAMSALKRAILFQEIDEKVINQAVLRVLQNKLMRGIYTPNGN